MSQKQTDMQQALAKLKEAVSAPGWTGLPESVSDLEGKAEAFRRQWGWLPPSQAEKGGTKSKWTAGLWVKNRHLVMMARGDT